MKLFRRGSSILKKSTFLVNTAKKVTFSSPFMVAGATMTQKQNYSTWTWPKEDFNGIQVETIKPGDGK